jgi:hypothetical protein
MIFKHASVVQDNRVTWYHDIVRIEKYQGQRYEDISARIHYICNGAAIANNYDLLIDGTGIGEAVTEYLEDLGAIPIIFTGGNIHREHYSKKTGLNILESISVPKKDLVHAGVVLMQEGRIGIAPGPYTDEFFTQAKHYRMNRSTGKIEADEDAVHDDLISCYIMGAWFINYQRGGLPSDIKINRQENYESWTNKL